MIHFPTLFLASCLLFAGLPPCAQAELRPLAPAPSPADNPLKGLVPYAGAESAAFPHSLEFGYLALADLMKGPESFDWTALESLLTGTASRGHQAIFRVWLEYPGKEGGIPGFLLQKGLKVTAWSEGAGKERHLTPDYTDENLITALEQFIAALGRQYDGDPRIGYITAGLLGSWGEWHTYPREDLSAPVPTQRRVLHAWEKAFTKTRVLLRYPAGADSRTHAPNAERPFGYHDDSFAWGTIHDPTRENTDWFFMTSLRAAGPAALEKWRTRPIGGEIRPEAWGRVFDARPEHPEIQDFAECVRQTHVSWLMDSGMFQEGQPPERRQRALDQVRRMGYEFYVGSADIVRDGTKLTVKLALTNQGVAPFYQDWRLELAALNPDGQITERWPVDWKLTGLPPGAAAREWRTEISLSAHPRGGAVLALRVIHPLANGKPLRFANATQDQHAPGWMTLGVLP